MARIAKFEKVSKTQFEKDGGEGYDFIILPQRATSGSAGYDFYSSEEIVIPSDSEKLIPTYEIAKISDGWVLCIFPRSGLGFKYGIALKNTVGVIDSDYYFSAASAFCLLCRRGLSEPSFRECQQQENRYQRTRIL